MEPLGERALKRGLISREQLESALKVQRDAARLGSSLRLGQILLQQGHLTSDVVIDLLEEQIGPEFKRDIAEAIPVDESEEVPPRIGPYIILGELGRGAVGTVYRAHHPHLKRDVALKVLRRDAAAQSGVIDRFLREARAVAKLNHPHIVPVYDSGHADGRHFIVMELVKGVPLSERATAAGWPLRRRVGIIEKVARAIHHAHLNHVVHRDIKPQNILLDENDEPHIADFGMARFVAEATINVADMATRPGVAVGTPYYMSPEQVRGEQEQIDARADVYSLGAVLYLLLSGAHPHEGSSIAEIYGHILHGDPVPPRRINPEIPEDVQSIVMRAIDVDRNRRYASAADFADDLRRWLEEEPVRARPIGTTAKIVRQARRNPIATGSMVTASVALVAAGVFAMLFADVARDRRRIVERLQQENVGRSDLEREAAARAAFARLLQEEARRLEPELPWDDHRARVQGALDQLPAGYALPRGIALEMLGFEAQAETELTQALTIPADAPEARRRRTRLQLRRLALAWYHDPGTPDARSLLERAKADAPGGGDEASRAMRAWELLIDGRFEDAVRAALEEVVRGGRIELFEIPCALACIELGRMPEAIEHVSVGLNRNPGSDLLHLIRGRTLERQSALEGAASDYTAALRINPRLMEAYLSRARVVSVRGDHRGAIADIERALDLVPRLPQALLQRAETRSLMAGSDRAQWELIRADATHAALEAGTNDALRTRAERAIAAAKQVLEP